MNSAAGKTHCGKWTANLPDGIFMTRLVCRQAPGHEGPHRGSTRHEWRDGERPALPGEVRAQTSSMITTDFTRTQLAQTVASAITDALIECYPEARFTATAERDDWSDFVAGRVVDHLHDIVVIRLAGDVR